MSQAAKDLGIPEDDLYYALMLVRDLRAKYLATNGDPRALRIALIYANLSDRHFASKNLSTEDMNRLSDIGVTLYKQTVESMRKKGIC